VVCTTTLEALMAATGITLRTEEHAS